MGYLIKIRRALSELKSIVIGVYDLKFKVIKGYEFLLNRVFIIRYG